MFQWRLSRLLQVRGCPAIIHTLVLLLRGTMLLMTAALCPVPDGLKPERAQVLIFC